MDEYPIQVTSDSLEKDPAGGSEVEWAPGWLHIAAILQVLEDLHCNICIREKIL